MTKTTLQDPQLQSGSDLKNLWLDDPSSNWRVEAGVVNVFAVYARKALEDGRRWHLFEVKAGEQFFGLTPLSVQGGTIRFIACPGTGAKVRRCEGNGPDKTSGSAVEADIAAFDTWVRRLLEYLGRNPGKGQTQARLHEDSAQALPAGTEATAVDGLVWVSAASGCFCYSRKPDMCFGPGDGAVPVIPGMHIRMVEAGHITVTGTGSYHTEHGHLPESALLIQLFCAAVAQRIIHQHAAEQKETLQRSQEDRSVFSRSLLQLAEPLLEQGRHGARTFTWSNVMRKDFLFWTVLGILVLICLLWFCYLTSMTVKDWRFRRQAAAYRAEFLADYKGPLRIGVASAGNTDHDKTLWRGIELAANEINAQGGVLGRKIELIFRNDQGRTEEARKIAQEFSEDLSLSAVIGHRFSPVSLSTAMIYEYYGLLMICPRTTTPKLTQQGYRRVFRTNLSGDMYGRLMADFATRKGYKRVSILYLDNEFGKGVANAFEARADEIGMVVVDRMPHTTEVTVKEIHDKMAFWHRNLDFDAVVLVTVMEYGPQFIRIAREEGIAQPMILSESLDSSDIIGRIGGSQKNVDNLYFASLYHPDAPFKGAREFARRYTAAYGTQPNGLAAQGYDTTRLLAKAVGDAKSLVPDKIAEQLRRVKQLEGVTGPQTITTQGDMIKPLQFNVIRDGVFVHYTSQEANGAGEEHAAGKTHVKR